eukprot:EG_transcript_17670
MAGKPTQRSLLASFGAPAQPPAKRPKKSASAPAAAPNGPHVVLRVASWNTDGLDETLLLERAGEVCSILLEAQPGWDVVMLQEVVPRTASVFRGRFRAAGYKEVRPPPPDQYFTLMFVREAGAPAVRLTDGKRVPFVGSEMGRDLLTATVQCGGVTVRCMTSHFESLASGAAERQKQLHTVVQQLTGPEPAVFAGDTNLREKEVRAEPGLRAVVDAWEAGGAAGPQRYTWYVRENGRQVQPPMGFRFDRMWAGGAQQVRSFRLLGTELMSEGCYPSDHFGIGAEVLLPAGRAGDGPANPGPGQG